MIPAADATLGERSISRLLDPATVATLLRGVLSAAAALPGTVRKVRVERCWPGRHGELFFEWSFTLRRGRRSTLFGVAPCKPSAAGEQEISGASLTPTGLRGVRRYLPEWSLLIHSPDCDPAMPHLAECLDARKMAVHLQPLWGQEHALQTSSAPAVECRTLGYRAGRRAAIAYRRVAAESPSQGFLGKTFRDRREEKLARTHRELSEQLAWYTQGRVRVPLPRGHLPNLHMTLFSWAGGKRATGKMVTPANGAFAAVDVLAALHRTSLDGVPTFSVEDECGIVEHWHAALERVDPSSAAATKPLLDRLLETAGTLGPTAPCTIHRDFYDRQLIVGRRTTTLLDLDTLARGAPSVDLGNLLAHLFLAALGAERTPAEFEKLAGKLIARYEGQKGPVDRRALAFFWATALFRVGAVHAFRTATHRHAPAMWASAEHVLKTVKMRSSSNARVGRAKGRGRQRLATKGSA